MLWCFDHGSLLKWSDDAPDVKTSKRILLMLAFFIAWFGKLFPVLGDSLIQFP
jgi:hypothetical protein